MLSYESIVSISFRWIDFTIIIALAAYIFWRWGLPFFKKEAQAESRKWQELESKISMHMSVAQSLEATLVYDEQHIKKLEQDILLWNAIHKKKQVQQAKQQELVIDQLSRQQMKKQMNVANMVVYQQAVPQALQDAQSELKSFFVDIEAKRAFVTKIMTRLEKGNV